MRFDTLGQWLDWQTTLHPKEIDLGLDRVAGVWRRLKPEGLQTLVVTVAGTNGKGSSVAMLESIYRYAGYRVGAYTSPHLVRYNERIRICGQEVSDAALCHAFEQVDQARGRTVLTYFEFATLAALILFAEQELDLVILEVGLGGRLDAVNIIDADVALITTVDLDHIDWLGNDRQQIGLEKAGIMRTGRPVVMGDSAIPESVLDYVEKIGAELYLQGRDFKVLQHGSTWQWEMEGAATLILPHVGFSYSEGYINNTSAVIMVCSLLHAWLPLGQRQISKGLSQVSLQGRTQLIEGKPSLLLDVAHNTQSVSTLKKYLDSQTWPGNIVALFGLLQDKNAESIVEIIKPAISSWYLLDLPGNRGQTAEQLARAVRQSGVNGPIYCHHNFASAFEAAQSEAKPQDLLLIFGSFLIVGDALQYLNTNL